MQDIQDDLVLDSGSQKNYFTKARLSKRRSKYVLCRYTDENSFTKREMTPQDR